MGAEDFPGKRSNRVGFAGVFSAVLLLLSKWRDLIRGANLSKGTNPSDVESSEVRLWLLFLLIVGSRLLFSFVIFPVIVGDGYRLNTVPDDYDKIARSLANGHGYVLAPGTAPTMQRLPFYPFFLVPFFALFGRSYWPIQIVQAFIDGGSGVLVCRITEQIYRHRAVSRLATWLFAIYPGFLVAAARMGTESLYTFLILVAVLLLIVAKQPHAWGRLVATGAVLGLAGLCRSAGLLLPACLGIFTGVGVAQGGRAVAILKTTTLLFAGMLVLMSPWIVRNYLLIGHPLATSTNGGSTVYDAFYLATNPSKNPFISREKYVDLAKLKQYPIVSSHGIQTYAPKFPFWFLRSEDEYRADKIMYQTIAEGFREAPQLIPRFLVNNALGFWFTAGSQDASFVSVLVHLPLLIAALMGLRRSYIEGRKGAGLLVAIIVYFNLFYTVSHGMARYSIPIMPFVIILAAKGLSDLAGRWREKAAENAMLDRALPSAGGKSA